jgi:hypothetical protein
LDELKCLFCGLQGSPSTEHVIPLWVKRCFKPQGPITLTFSDGDQATSTLQQRYLTVTLEEMVCEACNNGWMSRLENKVAPFLGEMIRNVARQSLDRDQQQLLATWACKTVLLLEYALAQRHGPRRSQAGYAATEAEFAWLFKNQAPPPRAQVWLGAFDAKNTIFLKQDPRNLVLTREGVRNSDEIPCHLTTTSIGFAAFQVYSIDYVAADLAGRAQFEVAPPEALKDRLSCIWPINTAPVSWPPPLYFSSEQFETIATWNGRF